MVADADVVFMPYSYVLDPVTRKQLGPMRWQGAVVILDEAHNVQVGNASGVEAVQIGATPAGLRSLVCVMWRVWFQRV